MAIPDHHKENFEMMLQAFKHGHLSILDCKDSKTGEQVIVVAASFRDKSGQYNMVPFAKMFDGNPYEELEPPSTYIEEDYISRASKYLSTASPKEIEGLMSKFFEDKAAKFYGRCNVYLEREDILPTFAQIKDFFALQDDLPIEPFLDFVDDHVLEVNSDEETSPDKG